VLLHSHRKSYLGFPCTGCRGPIRALSILADLPTPVFERSELVALTCPSCGHEDQYDLKAIARFEEHQIH